MDKANIAEWLLRWVVDPARASEFVGDQLEAHPAAGNLRFWLAIARVFLAFSWRTIVGMVASPIVGLILTVGLIVFQIPQSGGSLGWSVSSVIHVWVYLIGVCFLLWAATVFSLVRFGRRSLIAGTGLMASILCSASLNFVGQRIPSIVLAILWIGFFVFSLSNAKRRRALGTLSVAVFAAWLTAFALSVIPHDPYSVFGKWQFLTATVLVPIIESGSMLLLRRRFLV
jgi:hypothetical protein